MAVARDVRVKEKTITPLVDIWDLTLGNFCHCLGFFVVNPQLITVAVLRLTWFDRLGVWFYANDDRRTNNLGD